VTGAGAEAPRRTDVAIVGAGAAGLFAGIWAGRAAQEAGAGLRVEAFDGARRLGAKILVAGGGRCNVTHWRVDDADYAGSTPPAIRKVLRRFGVEDAIGYVRNDELIEVTPHAVRMRKRALGASDRKVSKRT
jgi:predicted flavoprotein YhiN